MPTPQYTALATVTLSSTASSVSFSVAGLTGYRDLMLVMNTGLTSSQGVFIWLNSDTTSGNYPSVWMNGNGSSAASGSGNAGGVRVSVTNYTTGPATSQIHFMDYAATDKHKTVLVRHDNTGVETSASASRWANTSAITGIGIIPISTTFTAGSTFSLYGVK